MKKTVLFRRIIPFVLMISFVLPICGMAENIGEIAGISDEALGKISTELITEFSKISDNTKIRVNVELCDIGSNAVMELFAERYPVEHAVYTAAKESADISLPVIEGDLTLKDGVTAFQENQTNDTELQRAIELKRSIYKELYTKLNSAVLNQYAETAERIFVSTYAPFAIIETDKSTIIDLAEKNNVLSISQYIEREEQTEDLQLANQITRSDYVRDTYGNKGAGVKIGQIELAVPNVMDSYLDTANIVVRTGDPVSGDHATEVARILVGSDDNGGCDGLAPNATLYSCAYSNTATLFSGIEWLLDQGVNVINMSAGADYDGLYVDRDKWVDHIATQHDVHFVKSAGNNSEKITSPGMAYNAITVGGVNDNGNISVSGFTFPDYSNYEEDGNSGRAEKPNLVAPATNMWTRSNGDVASGTSYAAPQVAGTIAQMCSYNSALKVRQTAMGAILAASSAEKVDAVGSGTSGDSFMSSVRVSTNAQISDKEGAGILDSRWARGIVYYGNYWSQTITKDSFPYVKSVTINASSNSVTRVAIYWLKRNYIDHSTNGVTQYEFTDLDLRVYDPNGNLMGASITVASNFEIVQFTPTVTGSFPILKDTTTKPTLTLLPNNTILEVKPYETPYILRI